ncbi:MAG: T9SS type A sorting domain-containing protein [candidate division WOR-3 bacterium]|nr:T9SS type A sorting domain-containing protein [candidate division WOR-3 bacterium]
MSSGTLDQIAINYPGRVAVIEIHIDAAFPLFNTEANQRRYFYPAPYLYGSSWVYVTPWLWIDGTKRGRTTYATWQDSILSRMNRPSPFTCTMWGIYNQSAGNGTVYAKFRNDSIASITGRIRFVLTEDSIYYAGPNGDNWHNHVARDYLPDTGGTPVTIAPGDSVIVSRNFTIQSGWNANRCEIIAWIQSNVMLPDSTKEIWQGGMIKISQLTAIEEHISQKPLAMEPIPIPNPCVNNTKFIFKLGKKETYRISIFDVTGRKIREIKGYGSGEEQTVEWNLNSDSGQRVKSGVYFYRFITSNTEKSGKIVIR